MDIDTTTAPTATTDEDGVTTTTVNGVRTLLAPRSGPVTAGLLFRVGRADETLATSGITHLVEHLALHRHGLSDLHYNGATAAAYTHFAVTGTADDVVEYLNGVCAALRDLPVDRLETEKEILRTEAAGRGRGAADGTGVWRYGTRSYGLVDCAETGLPAITAEDVRDWARTRFTTENAVLWMTCDTLPEGLDLTLPAGEWRPAPEPTSALPATPAYFQGADGVVVLSSVLPRSTAARLFADVLGKELFRELRQKGGYSYTAAAEYHPRDTDHATLFAYADALPAKQDALVGAFVDVLAKLRAGRIEQADLDSVRASALAQFDSPELAASMLPAAAMNLLMRHRRLPVAAARAEIEAVTVSDLHRVARDMWADALMQVPGRGVDWAGLTAAPTSSPEIVSGRRYSAVENGKVALLIAKDGISLVTPNDRVTIRYAQCALMQIYPDGARHLVGEDGFSITVEPTLYHLTGGALAPLDAGVPPASVVRMPPRDPSRIPRPDPARNRPGPVGGPARSGAVTAWIWLLGTLTVILAAFTGLVALAQTDPELSPEGADWGGVFFLSLLTAVCAYPWIEFLRKRRRGEG
ncbi:M16 family metallopeptidase [Streptomyces yangpuensis]|uniref:M16 family metallopeptidase n=1 Tax=Streptomyces yangpuensis TaxID=1648182 RepID=UPI00364AE84F|nr:insulinase family protein [Streptomyces erythrochromogenes]